MALKSTGACGVVLGVLVGCQSGDMRPAKDASEGSRASPPAISVSAAAPAPKPSLGRCDERWATSATRDPLGLPAATLRHPSTWKVEAPEPGRLQLTPPTQDFQVVLSALKGGTMTDEQVEQLDHSSLAGLPILSPWRKIETSMATRVFTVTRQTPRTRLELYYYAGNGGLVVLSLESPEPLKLEAARQWENVLSCLELSFQ